MNFGYRSQSRVQIDEPQPSPPKFNHTIDDNGEDEEGYNLRWRPSSSNASDDEEPFTVRQKASLHIDCKGDYLGVPSHPSLMKILQKQGDKQVLFVDKILKFTSSGKMKQRILLITDFALYIADPNTDALKRRIALAAVDKLCLSEVGDNFIAIIVPTEYDLLMASIRKSEIVTVLVEATKSASNYELEVAFSNRFEYNATAELVKEVQFEEVEGGVRTRILTK